MNTLENILFYGGIGAVILGLIVMAIGIGADIFSERLGKLCIFLIGGGLICFLFGNFIYDNNTLEYEKADIIITIQDNIDKRFDYLNENVYRQLFMMGVRRLLGLGTGSTTVLK